MVVQDDADLPTLGIVGVGLLQPRDELPAPVTTLDTPQGLSIQQIDAAQQREGSVSDVLVVSLYGGVPSWHRRQARLPSTGLSK